MRKIACQTELLILPDGRVLAQNITPAMALVLGELNQTDLQFGPRVALAASMLGANAGCVQLEPSDNARRRTELNEAGSI